MQFTILNPSDKTSLLYRLLSSRKQPFLLAYEQLTDDIAAGRILTKAGNRYGRLTVHNYRCGAGRFRQYEATAGTIYLEDISAAWAEMFRLFLVERGYAKNSICCTMSRLKSVIRRWHAQGKLQYDGSGIYTSSEVTTAVYTPVDELQMMLDCNLSETLGAERVRDIYVMQSFVGLRYSDFAVLLDNPSLFIRTVGGRLFFEIKTQKTGEVVVIPVADVVKKILEKYNYNFGAPFSFQYYNLTIKEVSRLAGLTEDIVFSRTKGGKRVDTLVPKWKLISSHTARRTFATNAFLAGIPERSIMAITGHSTASSFQRYIRCSSLASAVKIANDDFFHIDLAVTLNLSNKNFELISNA